MGASTDNSVFWKNVIQQLLPESSVSVLPAGWKLPVLPQAVTLFLNHASRPDYDIRKLARIIETDTNLTCELLRHVNSAAFGLRHRCKGVQQALVSLGIRRSKMLLMTAAIHSTVRKYNTKLFDLHRFWSDNLERACFAREIALQLGVDAELAYTGAMLQDFVLPVLCHTYKESYLRYWDEKTPPEDLADYEFHHLGANHAQIGAFCLQQWNVPEELICSALCHHLSFEELEELGLKQTHLHAIAASSLIPQSVPQHRQAAMSLSSWDQHDPSFDLTEIAERVDDELNAEETCPSDRIPLVTRIEELLMTHLMGEAVQKSMIGRLFGNFRVESCLGEGAMGTVYYAEHTLMQRPAAVKVLNPEIVGHESLARFEREVQSSSRLKHPNNISIYDYGRTPDGTFYYAMEYVQGASLKELVLKHGPLPAGMVISICRQLCGALREAHSIDLIHRDIKPENVLISLHREEGECVTLLDFGLVVDLSCQDPNRPAESSISGTPLYLAPEAIDQPGFCSPQSDLYSLGAVAYFLLTGHPLFTGNNAIDICLKQMSTQPDPPSSRTDLPIPADLESLVMSCLHKDAGKRPASALELERALQDCAENEAWSLAASQKWWENSPVLEITPRSSNLDETRGDQDDTVIFPPGS